MQDTSNNSLSVEEILILSLIAGIIISPVYEKIRNYFISLKQEIIAYAVILIIFIVLFLVIHFIYRILRPKRYNIVYVKDKAKAKKIETKEIEIKHKQNGNSNNNREQAKSKNVAVNALPKQRSHKVNVDVDKRFFKHKDLSIYDLKYLISKGYKEIKCLNIQGKKELYLIKPRGNESLEHCFLTFNIAEYLKSKKYKTELYISVKPDIVFEANKNKWAIEIETGKMHKNNRKQLIEKVKRLNKEYGNNWFFVVTDWNLTSKYSELGKVLTKRNFIKKIDKAIRNANF
jgi:hypothetical protein